MKLRFYLVLLVLATVLPVVLFAGIMIHRSYEQHRERLEQAMIERARAISAALDREFLVSIQSLKVLGASTRIDKEQLAEFYGDMKGALAAYSRAWQNLTLTDETGQQLINLRRPFGSALPTSGNPEAVKHAVERGDAVIADLSPGPVTGTLAVVVHVPVIRDGRAKYVLNAIFYPAPLTELLLQQKLPAGWIATILDRSQKIVARTQNIEKFIGKPAGSTFAAQAKKYQEANWRGTTLDGTAVAAALHRSDFTGWTVGLASPSGDLEAPLQRSLILTAAGGLGLLLIALLLAAKLGQLIAEPVAALAGEAARLGRGEAPRALRSPILEVNRVAQAIEDAGAKRAQAEARIQHLNRVYAVLSDINQAIVRIREPQRLLSEACRIAVEQGGFKLAWIGRLDRQTGRIESTAQAGFSDGYVEQLTILPGNKQHDQGPLLSALRLGSHEVCNDIEGDPRMAPWRDEALRRGYRSFAAFPLKVASEVFGTFNLYATERGSFDAEEVRLLDELAGDLSLALEIQHNESERLRAESALRDSEERFRQLAENIREVFWLSTPDKSRIIYVSPGYQTIWGRSCQSLYDSPRDWLDAIHLDDRGRVLDAALKDQQSGAYDQEFRIVRSDGAIRWIRDRAFPVRDANGEIYRIAGIAEDTTARKEAEEALKRSHEELEEKVAARTRDLVDANVRLADLDRLKSQFLANMSHELRTPLNAIIGFSQLIHDDKAGPVSPIQREYLGDILTSSKHLLHLIDDILDLAKVESGKMEVLNSTFRVDEIIDEVVHNIAPGMSAKEIKLVRGIPGNLGPITTDRRKFLQILLNLASNAVKFTERGEIAIRCERISDTLRVSVSDTGVGIQAEDMALLFQPFSQVDDSLRKRHIGTGLGLYLSMSLAHLLGGTITVESEYGRGSTFTLTLPIARSPRSPAVTA